MHVSCSSMFKRRSMRPILVAKNIVTEWQSHLPGCPIINWRRVHSLPSIYVETPAVARLPIIKFFPLFSIFEGIRAILMAKGETNLYCKDLETPVVAKYNKKFLVLDYRTKGHVDGFFFSATATIVDLVHPSESTPVSLICTWNELLANK